MTQGRKTVLARISGRVQGVGFRFWTRTQADRLNLDGWVRNEHDGSVSAMISGSEPSIATMLELLWKGPDGSFVKDVRTEEASQDELRRGFSIDE